MATEPCWSGLGAGLRSLGRRACFDYEPERLEPSKEAPAFPLRVGAAVEIVRTEVFITCGGAGKDVPGGDQEQPSSRRTLYSKRCGGILRLFASNLAKVLAVRSCICTAMAVPCSNSRMSSPSARETHSIGREFAPPTFGSSAR